jgi:hypothetical protein
MNFHFSIPTPENCISCPFKEVRVSQGYGPLKLRCMIDPSLDILAKDGLTKRSDQCPGKVEEED